MNLLERPSALLHDLLTPVRDFLERRADPRYPSSARARLFWREGDVDREAPAELIDISQGGAGLRVRVAPPRSAAVAVRIDGLGFGEAVEAEVVGVEPGRVSVKFRRGCPTELLEAAVSGRHRGRRGRRHDPSSGVESLEGRQLLTTAAAFAPGPATSVMVGPVYTGSAAPTLFDTASNALLTAALYESPSRMASGIAADGAVGVNADWEEGGSPSWFIEEQRYGADFVQAGLVTGNTALVGRGWQILEWGFAREAPNGSFPGTGDAFHSTSMFVEAGARALLLEVQSGSPEAAQLVAQYLPKVDASARWLMTPSVAAKGDANDAPYSHRLWLLAAALGETAALTNDPATMSAAEGYARRGLSAQTADGMDPEDGGGDASYQAYGILLAEHFATVCPDPDLRAEVGSIIVHGLNWEEQWIDPAGHVSIAGSTRTGVEDSRAGTVKTIDYKTIVQAFSVATTVTGDPSYRSVASAVASGRGWAVS